MKEGDAVTKGQVLATLDLTEINAQVAQYKLGFEKAKRDYERTGNLYKDSVATLEQFENAKTALDLATQQLSAAEFNLTHSRVVASENGYVLKKLAAEGQLTNAGAPVFLINGVSSGKWMLRVGLSDKQWSMVKVNDTARVFADTRSGNAISGTVIRKSEGVDPASGVLTADIQLSNADVKGFAEGVFGKAEIYYDNARANEKTGAYTIPYDAVLDGDGRTGYVYVTNDNFTAHKVKVTIDNLLKDNVVISDGLQDAKAVIVTGSAYLTENSKIRIIQ